MLFNSIDFAVFFPVVFLLYWFATNNNLKLQNILIVSASYLFYGWWDWRFLSLILCSTIVDYVIGWRLGKEQHSIRRKIYLWISIIVNLGLLGFFKYYNFFVENFLTAFSFVGVDFSATTLNIILPVGISFYTFQTLSYTIDVYKKKLKPTNDFISFAAFVSFFPQLVAGPIERATNLLPQFCRKRTFEYANAVDGLRQILWGLVKKIVIADSCAVYVNQIFSNPTDYSGCILFLGAVFFAFQIYGDFSGYSDIAIGTARLLGFSLMQNFAFPYFSRDIAEFWRRWHISLSTWFRDYLYIPIGGSRGNIWQKIRNIFVIFIVSGFWHGANWTFIIWGVLNALYLLPLLLIKRNRNNMQTVAEGKLFPTVRQFISMSFTFFVTVFAWIFFRSENVSQAFLYIERIFFDPYSFLLLSSYSSYVQIIVILFIFVVIEWFGRGGKYAIEEIGERWIKPCRYALYYALVFVIFWYGGQEQQFIYFQF